MEKSANPPLAKVVNDFFAMANPKRNVRKSQTKLTFEQLENRCVLSASTALVPSAVGPIDADTALVAQAVEFDTVVESVTVRINGEEQVLDLEQAQIQLADGDTLEIVEIGLGTNATDGVIAVEGYINKINNPNGASEIDYSDGRFSLRDKNLVADGSAGVVQGLDGVWEVGSGWDRLSLVVLHYTEDGTETVDLQQITLEVGVADFAFDVPYLEQIGDTVGRVGEQFDISARWFNDGAGTFHNYAEVDIYHESNLDQIIWAGALVGNPSGDGVVEGLFQNTRADDGFDEFFTPSEEGGYLLRFYLDPEAAVAESDESNNQVDVKILVEGAKPENERQQPATEFQVHDVLKLTFANENQFSWGFGVQNKSNQAVENWVVQIQEADYKIDASQLTNSDAFEFSFTENSNGTFNYTFTGTQPIEAFSGITGGNIEWRGVNFEFNPSSASFEVGQFVSTKPAADVDTTPTADLDFAFVSSDEVRFNFVNEQRFSFGFGVQNTGSEPVENWAVQILDANYELDASQFKSSAEFDLTTTKNEDGTYNHLFVGTSPLEAFRSESLRFLDGDFGFTLESSGLEVGQLVKV